MNDMAKNYKEKYKQVIRELFIECLDRKLLKYPEWLREQLRQDLIQEFDDGKI